MSDIQPILKENNKAVSRRKFLKKLWAGLGIIAGLEFAGLLFTFLGSREAKHAGAKANSIRTVSAIENIPYDTVTPVKSGQFYLVRLKDGGFLAMSLRCTHLGCSVAWDDKNHEFICPCHSSGFDMKGNVINPPAPRALDLHPVIIEGGMVKVDTGKKIERKRFNLKQVVYA